MRTRYAPDDDDDEEFEEPCCFAPPHAVRMSARKVTAATLITFDDLSSAVPGFLRKTGKRARMKAAVIEHRGESAAIKDVADPKPGEREILIRVVAAGVNPADWKTRDEGERRLPFVLGQDFAGIVVDAGAHAHKYNVDERVFGIAREHGAYAELTVVPEDDHTQPVAKIPDELGDAEAAALPTAGLTALASLDALGVQAGTKLVVLGATGGVGSFAVQIARDRGAHTIGTARSDNEELARSFGVDEFVAYDRDDPVAAIKRAYPDGVDAVLDG